MSSEPKLISQRILILLPDRDSPPSKDHRNVFLPEASGLKKTYESEGAFVGMVQIPVPTVDPRTLTISSAAKQLAFEAAARASISAILREPWDRIVILCHGWNSGLQLGFRIRKQKGKDKENMDSFIGALRQSAPKTVTLFACSAGDEPASQESSPGTGDGSIGDYIRDSVGCTVIAHWTVGHATRNPDLIVFNASPDPVIGGIAWPARGTSAYRNAARLLTQKKDAKSGKAPGQSAPKGGTRLAFTSIPLCNSVADLQSLLSMPPAF